MKIKNVHIIYTSHSQIVLCIVLELTTCIAKMYIHV